MKRLIPILLLMLLCGCASKEFICGNALFIFVDAGDEAFSVNFRDDRLLKSDVVLAGRIQEWAPGSKWKAEPYFKISAELDSKEEIPEVELAVERGSAGERSYSRVVVFKASAFAGSAKILPFEFGGTQPDGRLVLNFKRGEEWLRCEVDLATLLKKRPNSEGSTYKGSAAPERAAGPRLNKPVSSED